MPHGDSHEVLEIHIPDHIHLEEDGIVAAGPQGGRDQLALRAADVPHHDSGPVGRIGVADAFAKTGGDVGDDRT